MQILFINHSIRLSYGFSFGYELLCNVLESEGHNVTKAYVVSTEKRTEIDLFLQLIRNKYDLIAISVLNNTIHDMKPYTKLMKNNSAKVVIGGNCSVFTWKDWIKEDWIDMVVVGDGELPLKMIANQEDKSTIPNLVYKKNNKIIVNKKTFVQEDLDEYPSIIYDEYVNNELISKVLFNRGCPNRCSHCQHSTKHKFFPKPYYRKPSINYILNTFKRRKHANYFEMLDDLFICNDESFFEFCDRYPKEVGIPFIGAAHANYLTDDVINALYKAGCVAVQMGFESSVPKNLRWLNRHYTPDNIRDVVNKIHSKGMYVKSTNMIGYPNEYDWEAYGTLQLNLELLVDVIYWYIFVPVKGTTGYEYCVKKGHFNDVGFWRNYNTMLTNTNFTPEYIRYLKMYLTWMLNVELGNEEYKEHLGKYDTMEEIAVVDKKLDAAHAGKMHYKLYSIHNTMSVLVKEDGSEPNAAVRGLK